MHRVLVTAVGGNVGQGVVKALRAGTRDYVIVGADMEPRSAGFSFVDRACVLPGATDPEALAVRLTGIIQAERIEAIFVCSPAELSFYTAHAAQLQAATGVRVLINPPDVIRIGRDKLETARFLERHGFPFPETAPAADDAAVDRLFDRWGTPVVAKPRYGASSVNVLRLPSRDAVDAARRLVPDLVVQRWLPGDAEEYTAGVVGSAAARAFAWIVLRRDLLQGTTYRTELVQDPAIGEQMVAVAQALGVEGACNFQFRLVDGVPIVFEINPRFSGTSGMRYLYGFNDPEMVFAHQCLDEPIRQPVVRPGVVLRYWNEVHLPDATFATMSADSIAIGQPVVQPATRGAPVADS
jgi:carbamoyl-phosphate synthase large subunit